MINKNYYYLRVRSFGPGVIAGLNNAPIFRDYSGSGRSIILPINEFLLPGKNTLNADLFWPSNKDYAAGVSTLEAELFKADPKNTGVCLPSRKSSKLNSWLASRTNSTSSRK